MLIPTDDGQLALAEENDVRVEMIRYIRTHFSNLLGEDVRLLDLPNGLEILSKKYAPGGNAGTAAA